MDPSLAELASSLLVVGLLVVASAFFSGTEVAMFSLRRAERQRMARSERGADKLVTRLVAHPRRLIATVLLGNETANVSLSAVMAGVGQQLFEGQPELSIALLTTAITLPILLLVGEITPKTIAIKTAPGWSRMSARPLWVFGVLITPLYWVVNTISGALIRAFGVDSRQPGPSRAMGEDEFRTLVDAGNAEGEIDARERRLIHRVFEFGDKRVSQVMVGRDKAFMLSSKMPVARMVAEVSQRGYSRVPVYQQNRDDILGVLFAKDLVLVGTGQDSSRRIADLLHTPLYVPRSMKLERLFGLFKDRRTHMAVVVDEYGQFLGLVTMEDLLEELFGPIRDEKEVRARARTNAGLASLVEVEAEAANDAVAGGDAP